MSIRVIGVAVIVAALMVAPVVALSPQQAAEPTPLKAGTGTFSTTASGCSGAGAVVFSSNASLSSNLSAQCVTIASGVYLLTNGFNIIVNGTFDNGGTLVGGPAPYRSFVESFGGSGGGSQSYVYRHYATSGRSTHAPGGKRNIAYVPYTSNVWAGNGSTPSPPTVTYSLIRSWLHGWMLLHLAGAGGGHITGYVAGGSGSYGIYIQATTIIAGNIEVAGGNGSGTGSGIGQTAGGGGGVILLAYGLGGLTSGTYNVNGGASSASLAGNVFSGYGGAGQVLTFSYGSTPP